MVAAASASAEVRASTVTASAMPRLNERPRQPAHRQRRVERDHAVQCRVGDVGDQPGGQALALCEMQRDVAAIVDIGAREIAGGDQRPQHLVGDRAGDRRHRRDEDIAIRPASLDHATRNGAGHGRLPSPIGRGRRAQARG
jgi:hypothetical protein